ncbi:MAG: hypothetical protein Fur0019_13250 [Tibeticola sp.]
MAFEWFEPALSRLRAAVTGMREIGGASSLAEAMDGARAVPAMYLIPMVERAQEAGPHTGATDQFIDCRFAVIFAVPALRSTQGSDALLALDAARAQARQALVGWAPDDVSGEPVLYSGGQLMDVSGARHLWWADEYTLRTYCRSEP